VQVPVVAGTAYFVEAVDLSPLGVGSLHLTFSAQPDDVVPDRFQVYIPVVIAR